MKKLNFLNLLAAGLLSAAMLNITSCTKEQSGIPDGKQPDQTLMKNQVVANFNYDNESNTLTGSDLASELNWTSNGVEVGNVFLNSSELEEITIISNTDNVLTYEISGKVFSITTVESNSDDLIFNVAGPENRQVSFNISGGSEDLNKYFENFYVGQTINIGTNKTQWIQLVFGAAVLIAAVVDSYCDDVIKSQVNLCSSGGHFPEIKVCKVICHTTPGPW